MSKINLADTLSGYNLSVINQNFDKIADVLNDEVLFRENPVGEPNEMNNNLDMNGFHILNLPTPAGPNEPLRLKDLPTITGGTTTAILTQFTPYKTITAQNVQAAIDQLKDETDVTQTTLQGEITTLQGQVVSLQGSVQSIAALRTFPTTSNLFVRVASYYGDGVTTQGTYYYDSTDTTSLDNGGTIIVGVGGARWKLTQKNRISIKQFGAKGDDVNLDTAAWKAIIAWYASNGGGVITIPAGTYKVDDALTYTFPIDYQSITFQGDGVDTSIIHFTLNQGITFNYKGPFNAVHMRDITFTASQANTGTCIKIVQTLASYGAPANSALSEFNNVSIRGADGYQVNWYYNIGIDIHGASNFNFTNVVIAGLNNGGGYVSTGTGVIIQGTANLVPVVFNFLGCTFNGLGIGIIYGTYTQGVSVNQCNFTGGSYGIITQGILLDQFNVYGTQFNCGTAGINQINFAPQSSIFGNLFICPGSSSGVTFVESAEYSIMGNSFIGFNPTTANGIVVSGTQSNLGGIITGNVFAGLSGSGVFLQATSNHANVQSNSYFSNGTNVTNSGTLNVVGGGSP